MVAEPDSTKATPNQLSFPTSPNRLTIGDCTSATIVLSSEKRRVEERIVRTMRIHCPGLVDMLDALDNETHQRFGDLGLKILLDKVHILNSFPSTILAFSIHIALSHVNQRRKDGGEATRSGTVMKQGKSVKGHLAHVICCTTTPGYSVN